MNQSEHLSPIQKETIILTAKTEGCGDCGVGLVDITTGAMSHIRWVRDSSVPGGFRVYCRTCFKKWWEQSGKKEEAP